jgi:hypothetical protein
MNMSHFRSTLLALAALALPHTANASLLVGWHDFDGTSNSETPDYAAGGFSGLLTKHSESRDLGGDNGGTGGIYYGNSNIASGPGNDGTVRLPTGGETFFSMTNSSGSAVSLASLFFDASESSNTTVLSVAYRIGAGTFTTLATYSTLNPTGTPFDNLLLQSDFSDLSISLLAIPALLNSQTIQFRFNVGGAGQGARIDNLAITAIPEPASLIALACVLGSGLFLRQRPRQLAPGLA